MNDLTHRRFRFAPTPSRPLHWGSGFAALIGWAASRAAHGAFILRIEDIDRARCRPAHEAELLRDLAWLGIDWDEGPDVGGPVGPYRQSERIDRYDAALAELVAQGWAYPCSCSRREVAESQRAPHLGVAGARGEAPSPGTCRPAARGAPPARDLARDRGGYRLAVAFLEDAGGPGPCVAWTDAWCGPQREDVRKTCGDLLLGRPGAPSYQLAVVVDDIAMGVTDVVRGRDLLGSTARQILLHRLLGHRPPRFAHHPLIVDRHGRKLSKREGGETLAASRRSGTDPEALIAWLATRAGLAAPGTPRLSLGDLTMRLARHISDGALIRAVR